MSAPGSARPPPDHPLSARGTRRRLCPARQLTAVAGAVDGEHVEHVAPRPEAARQQVGESCAVPIANVRPADAAQRFVRTKRSFVPS